MMKSRKWFALLAALILGVSIWAAGLSMTAFAAVNGWEDGTPEGAAANYGGNKAWPMAPGDMGEGFTRWVFENSHTIANSTALDVTKPITLTYSTRMNVTDNWVMFALATSFENATKITTGVQEAGNAQYRPFFFGHKAEDNTNGPRQLGEPVTWVMEAWEQIEDVCGIDHWSGWTALDFTEVEIYFGAEEAADGYILADGIYVGHPNVTQTAYESGYAYLMVSGFASSGVQIKVENDAEIKGTAYALSVSAENAEVVFDDIDVLRRADEGQTVSFAVNAAQGYRVVSVSAGEQTLTAGTDGKYSFVMPAADTTVTVVTEVIPDTYRVTVDGHVTAVFVSGSDVYEAGQTVSFTLTAEEGYRLDSVTLDGETLTPDGEGVYSFEMPASEVTVTAETVRLYRVTSSGEGASVVFENDGWYEANETVRFEVDVKSYYTLISVSVGDQTLTAEEGIYSFVMPEADCQVTIEAEPVYTAPTQDEIDGAVNGWNNTIYPEYAKYGPVVDAGGSSMVDEGEGYSNFVLYNSGSIGSVIGLDVTQPIFLDLLIKPNGPVPGPIPWFMIGLFDDWMITVESGADAYGGNGGLGAEVNERINFYRKLMFGFDYSNITSSQTLTPQSFGGVTLDTAALAQLTNKFGDAWSWTQGDHSTDYDYARFEIYIGATADEGYVLLDGVKIGTPTVTQADFHDGTAYLHLLSFYSARVQVRLRTEAELDYTAEVDEDAEIVFAEGTDLSALKTYDTVTFSVEIPENTGALVSLNGTELRPDAEGNYTLTLGYGENLLSVSVQPLVTVTFETNGGGTLDPVSLPAGSTLTAPVLEREGYTLSWCADSDLTTPFDFTAGVTQSCTVYALWTPVEYTISYYDGANRIRDILPVSYNIETETLTLPEAPEKEGYTFEGWYLSATFEGEKVETVEQGSTGNLTLYARYVEQTGNSCSDGCASVAGPGAAGLGLIALIGSAAVALKKKGRD